MKVLKDKDATYRDLEVLPDTVVGELIGGELFASPRPSLRHSDVQAGIAAELREKFRSGGSSGGWWSLTEPELHLGGDVLVPDVAGWRRERMPEVPDSPHATMAPDWVCEILSPSTAGFDRVRKMPLYLRHEIGHVWLVDPATRTIEVFRREVDRWVLAGQFAGDGAAVIEPFHGGEIDLRKIWPLAPTP